MNCKDLVKLAWAVKIQYKRPIFEGLDLYRADKKPLIKMLYDLREK